MNVDDKVILSRLDGFLNATSLFKSTSQGFMYGAFLIEGYANKFKADLALKKHYAEDQSTISLEKCVDDWVSWFEDELNVMLQEIPDKLRFELVWQQMEILRLLTNNFEGMPVEKYKVVLELFEGYCYVLQFESDYIVLQFFERMDEHL